MWSVRSATLSGHKAYFDGKICRNKGQDSREHDKIKAALCRLRHDLKAAAAGGLTTDGRLPKVAVKLKAQRVLCGRSVPTNHISVFNGYSQQGIWTSDQTHNLDDEMVKNQAPPSRQIGSELTPRDLIDRDRAR